MKRCLLLPMLFALAFSFNAAAQTYYPLPEENAYWTVLEFDYNTWQYNDVIYTVMGDSVINNLNYKVVYRLDDYPTIYDTISTLHCFMRQDVEEKKIWFIRHYLGETVEKLGYDLNVNVGDTVSLPAFQFGEFGDSLYYCQSIDSVNMEIIGELDGFRKDYWFSSTINSDMSINYIEGVKDWRSTFPNLDSFYGFDPFHQSETVCVLVNNTYYYGYEPFYKYCGFVVLDTDDYVINSELKIFPNPAWDIITVQLPDAFISPGTLTIYNNFGEPVLRREITGLNSSFAIDVSNFINGIYFLSINSNSITISTKLIVKP